MKKICISLLVITNHQTNTSASKWNWKIWCVFLQNQEQLLIIRIYDFVTSGFKGLQRNVQNFTKPILNITFNIHFSTIDRKKKKIFETEGPYYQDQINIPMITILVYKIFRLQNFLIVLKTTHLYTRKHIN